MAAKPFSTTRRALLGAAASLPVAAVPVQPSYAEALGEGVWNRRLADYRRLLAAKQAEETAGAFRAANNLYAVEADRTNREDIVAPPSPGRKSPLPPHPPLPYTLTRPTGAKRLRKLSLGSAREGERRGRPTWTRSFRLQLRSAPA